MAAKQKGPMLWRETPDLREGPVARVALLAAIDGQYSFAVPEPLADQVAPGKRLMVPFGRNRKPQPAFCVSVGIEQWTSTLKPVAEVLDDEPLLSEELIELGQWMARYYCCPLGRTLSAMVPEPVRKQSGYQTVRRVFASAGVAVEGLRSAKRKNIMELMIGRADGMELDALCEAAGASRNLVNAMARDGQLRIETSKRPMPAPDFDQPGAEPDFELNDTQKQAIERIASLAREDAFRAVLLFGVSGSGKTEVYIHAVRSVLATGRQAILLVPEIALTTQMVHRLTSRFEHVALIHSGLTGVQRSLTFAAIARGEKRVVIGTRSAVFAPCPDLGLIVVDEEQEGSYKNQQSPRFHTRDVAVKRAQMNQIPIVLGSATPSLETWHNCQRLRHFERIELPSRIAGLALPKVTLVDMEVEQQQRKGLHLVSRDMEKQLGLTLDAGQQAVLLLNRRGYANYLYCARCKTPLVCPNCKAYLVFHQARGKAVCHHCHKWMVVPERCGDVGCGGKLVRFGMGTERLEEEVARKFPQARIARADSDVMKHTRDYEELIRRFSQRAFDVLLGTQMIAKGLDFPFVSFVGVIDGETAMAQPDFRAAERTFQLVTQVAGRAGRAELSGGGRVVVQSQQGLSPAVRHAAQHDYPAFAVEELKIRKQLSYPPFSRLMRVVVSDRLESQARTKANELAEQLRGYISHHALPMEVLGPQSAPLARLRNQYRFDLLLRAPDAARLMKAVEQLRAADVLKITARHLLIDVDPVTVL